MGEHSVMLEAQHAAAGISGRRRDASGCVNENTDSFQACVGLLVSSGGRRDSLLQQAAASCVELKRSLSPSKEDPGHLADADSSCPSPPQVS